jgi:hypothetical protein
MGQRDDSVRDEESGVRIIRLSLMMVSMSRTSFELGKQRARVKEPKAIGDTRLFAMHLTNKCIRCVVIAASLLGGCGTLAPHESAAPSSHHAQQRYDEAVKKGNVVPAEKGKEDRK